MNTSRGRPSPALGGRHSVPDIPSRHYNRAQGPSAAPSAAERPPVTQKSVQPAPGASPSRLPIGQLGTAPDTQGVLGGVL